MPGWATRRDRVRQQSHQARRATTGTCSARCTTRSVVAVSPSQAKTKRAAGDACQDTWRAIGGIASAAGVADKHPERRVGHYPATASIAVVRASAPSLETAMTGRTNTGSAGSWFQNNPGFRATRKNVIIADATNTPDKSRKILSAVSSAPGYFR